MTTIVPAMDTKIRIVNQLPVRELWRDDGFSTIKRGVSLTAEDIRKLLSCGPVQFVVADVGAVPRWIPKDDCFLFWKNDAQTHLASEARASLNAFPNQYCYFASRWDQEREVPIVLLEKHH
jgi:hypothetical protein